MAIAVVAMRLATMDSGHGTPLVLPEDLAFDCSQNLGQSWTKM